MAAADETPGSWLSQKLWQQRSYHLTRDHGVVLGAEVMIGTDALDLAVARQRPLRWQRELAVHVGSDTRPELVVRSRGRRWWAVTFDVLDRDGHLVGVMRRHWLRSWLRDRWTVAGADGRRLGELVEDSPGAALLRRLLSRWRLRQDYHLVDANGHRLAWSHDHGTLFARLDVQIPDACGVDPRLVLAAGLLLVVVEGRQ